MHQTPLPESLVTTLTHLLGDRFTTEPTVLDEHGTDESSHPCSPPDAVCFPQSTEEVSAILKTCSGTRTPVIPFGKGTSVEGQVLAKHGGISIDLNRMNKILAVHDEDMDAVVQAGITRIQLNEALAGSDLFFSVDPGADATLGGMAGTRASGTNTVRYGTMRENVLALQVVLANGSVIQTSSRARKSAAGYDLTHLFIGSEGTLGIMTELTVRLHPVPECISSAVCPFPSVKDAVNAVIKTIQSGVPIARVELLDPLQIKAVNKYSDLNCAVAPTLFLEFNGTKNSVEEQSRSVQKIAAEFGGSQFEWSTDDDKRSRLWQARHNAYFAALDLRPGCRAMATDVCVPISRLAECIEETEKDVSRSSLDITILGHVGDGNFHLVIVFDPSSRQERAEAESLNRRVIERALAMEGTCTGEHGIGIGKLKFLQAEKGDGVDVMRQIKSALDPLNLMNPGKIFS
jgi:D-lactate dehydrogenase (cytochrome)